MRTEKIVLRGINDICDFVKAANLVEGEVTISQGKYIINGKSIMGIFSLKTDEPMNVAFSAKEDTFATIVENFAIKE